ncbi:MAG: phage tail protein, partial [Thermoflexales bacterium]|nr:phage tail protein [Thermoflexales bacterium]
PLTLERGVTHDPSFEEWANKALQYGAGHGAEMSLKSFRKDIIIEFLNEQGQLVKVWKVYRCWVSEYVALSELDANNAGFALERIVLQNEGWERDASVVEPAET